MVGASNDVFLVVLWVVVVRIGQDLLLWLFFLGYFWQANNFGDWNICFGNAG